MLFKVEGTTKEHVELIMDGEYNEPPPPTDGLDWCWEVLVMNLGAFFWYWKQ